MKTQVEVLVGNDIQLDYNNVEWISVDTEFLSLNQLQDQLCVIQIGSFVQGQYRVEILNVFNKKVEAKILELMLNEKIGKIFHYAKADVPRIEKFINNKLKGKIFDTYIAAKIILTNLADYSLEGLIQYLVDPKFQKNKKLSESEWDLPFEMWEENQIIYAANDVLYLESIMNKIEIIAKRRNREIILNDVMEVTPKILELSNQGYEIAKIF